MFFNHILNSLVELFKRNPMDQEQFKTLNQDQINLWLTTFLNDFYEIKIYLKEDSTNKFNYPFNFIVTGRLIQSNITKFSSVFSGSVAYYNQITKDVIISNEKLANYDIVIHDYHNDIKSDFTTLIRTAFSEKIDRFNAKIRLMAKLKVNRYIQSLNHYTTDDHVIIINKISDDIENLKMFLNLIKYITLPNLEGLTKLNLEPVKCSLYLQSGNLLKLNTIIDNLLKINASSPKKIYIKSYDLEYNIIFSINEFGKPMFYISSYTNIQNYGFCKYILLPKYAYPKTTFELSPIASVKNSHMVQYFNVVLYKSDCDSIDDIIDKSDPSYIGDAKRFIDLISSFIDKKIFMNFLFDQLLQQFITNYNLKKSSSNEIVEEEKFRFMLKNKNVKKELQNYYSNRIFYCELMDDKIIYPILKTYPYTIQFDLDLMKKLQTIIK